MKYIVGYLLKMTYLCSTKTSERRLMPQAYTKSKGHRALLDFTKTKEASGRSAGLTMSINRILTLSKNGEYYIFKGCDSLTKLVCYALVPPKDDNKEYNSWMFGFDQSKCTAYVPQASFVYYQVVNGWGKFNYTEPIETDVKTVNADPASEQECFGIDGKRLSSQQKGLNIVRKSDGTTSKVMVK